MVYSVKLEEGFAPIEESWRKLLPRFPARTIFSTPEWQRSWWRHFQQDRELWLLSLHHHDELVGIAPLMLRGDTLSLLGEGDTCDYLDLIVAQGHETGASAALLDYLLSREWRTFDLPCLSPGSVALTHFLPLVRARGLQVQTRSEDVCPGVDLPATWEEYLARLRRKDRHELRRKLRRLEKFSPIRYYQVENKSQLPQDLEDFILLFRQSGGHKAEFMTSRKAEFFREMGLALAERGYLRLFFLEVRGKRVSTAMCFDYNEERGLYNSGYDPDYAHLSVGLLLKVFCLQDAIACGKRRFDFLRGAEPYKYDLGAQDVPVYRCVISRG